MTQVSTRIARDVVIGERVKIALALKGLSQTELGVQLGWDRQRMWRLTSGKTQWTVADVESVATHLGVEAADLMGLMPSESESVIDAFLELRTRIEPHIVAPPTGLEPVTL